MESNLSHKSVDLKKKTWTFFGKYFNIKKKDKMHKWHVRKQKKNDFTWEATLSFWFQYIANIFFAAWGKFLQSGRNCQRNLSSVNNSFVAMKSLTKIVYLVFQLRLNIIRGDNSTHIIFNSSKKYKLFIWRWMDIQCK